MNDLHFSEETIKKIYDIYIQRVDDIFETCDWKTQLTPAEVVILVLESAEEVLKNGTRA